MIEKLLLVDDEPSVLAGLRRMLRKRFDVTTATSGEEGLHHLDSDRYAILISDYRMPGMDGVELLSRAKRQDPSVVRMLLTGYADLQAVMDAVNKGGIFRFLVKPILPDVLLPAIRAGLDQYRLIQAKQELDQLKTRFNLDFVYQLRTLISYSNMYLYMLEQADTKKRAHYQAQLRYTNRRLGHLGNNLLAVSRLDLTDTQAHVEPLDLNRVVERTVAAYQSLADGSSPLLQVALAPHLPPIQADDNLLQIAITGLIFHMLGQTKSASLDLETGSADGMVHLRVASGRRSPNGSGARLFTYPDRNWFVPDEPLDAERDLKVASELVECQGGRVDMETGARSTVACHVRFPAISGAIADDSEPCQDTASSMEEVRVAPTEPTDDTETVRGIDRSPRSSPAKEL
jgi:CheY-like chemotaxis protein